MKKEQWSSSLDTAYVVQVSAFQSMSMKLAVESTVKAMRESQSTQGGDVRTERRKKGDQREPIREPSYRKWQTLMLGRTLHLILMFMQMRFGRRIP